MIRLKEVSISKYKSIVSDQEFRVDDDITVLVGMNESGKTSVLEALAKTNYFDNDKKFKFNATHDYPRNEKKRMEKSGVRAKAVICEFEISEKLLGQIAEDIGASVFTQKNFSETTFYDNKCTVNNISVNFEKFVEKKTAQLKIGSKTLNDKLLKISGMDGLNKVISEYESDATKAALKTLSKYYENNYSWGACLTEYVYRTHIQPHLPKFLYYDEYYSLPSRICIEDLTNDDLEEEELKTAKALFDLADIKVDDLISADHFEDFKAELEATQAIIADELFKYWSTNNNLDIEFAIDKIEETDPQNNTRIVKHVLDIRVRNNRTRVSLPLKNRSKGFNWFFSFLVWFKKIQEDENSNYIILLDEPGLNLHASAQSDLLDFIEHLSENYQIIYTTHSPFMVDSNHLERVRTIVETDAGSVVSDSIQEKDPKTLFPLQAALGYDIAQNLYISKNNLLVEGVSDLIYLEIMSGLLEQIGKTGLNSAITIVPVGGMEKVATFVSLLRGSKLNTVCLLDSSIDSSSKAKLEEVVVHQKIIHEKKLVFFDRFVDSNEADIEDLFSKEDYLGLFNAGFSEHKDLKVNDLNGDIFRIVLQINSALGVERYNHYRPANALARSGRKAEEFSKESLDRFEKVFAFVNKLFE